MSVKRYDLEDADDGSIELVHRANGDWVAFDDYDALKDEYDNLKQAVLEAENILRGAL